MSNSENYKISSFRHIFVRLRWPRFVELFSCWDSMIRSWERSRFNCLLQSLNCSLIVLLMLLILPERFDLWFSTFSDFEWAFLPMGRIVATVVSYFIFQTISWFFAFPLSDIFETSLKITLWIMAGLLALILLIFNKLVFTLKERAKQDLILWQTNK